MAFLSGTLVHKFGGLVFGSEAIRLHRATSRTESVVRGGSRVTFWTVGALGVVRTLWRFTATVLHSTSGSLASVVSVLPGLVSVVLLVFVTLVSFYDACPALCLLVSEFVAPEALEVFVTIQVTVTSPMPWFVALETEVMFLWTSDLVLHTRFYNDFIAMVVTVVHGLNCST